MKTRRKPSAEFRVGAQRFSRAHEAGKEVANDLRTHGRIDVHGGAAPIGRLVNFWSRLEDGDAAWQHSAGAAAQLHPIEPFRHPPAVARIR